MIDKELGIIAQSILKSIPTPPPINSTKEETKAWIMDMFALKDDIINTYATIDEEDEWINTGVRVPKSYWDNRDQSIIGKDNQPQKTETGWFIFSQKKNIGEFKKMMDEREVSNGI